MAKPKTELHGRPGWDNESDEPIVETQPDGQRTAYEVLTEEERRKGCTRPVRTSYVHDKCGTATKCSDAIVETYARDPKFYSHTFCVRCRNHFPVGEFVWEGTNEVVGS